MDSEIELVSLIENLHYRYEYYNLKVLEAIKEKERSKEKMYKDKMEVIESLFRDIYNGGRINDYYISEIDKLKKKMNKKEEE